MNYGGLNLNVVWPELRCYGCDVTTAPELHQFWHEAGPLPPLATTKGTSFGSGIKAEIVGMTPESVIQAADEAGWRRINLYGKKLYVCPNCAKNRERPEWARRLTEEDAK